MAWMTGSNTGQPDPNAPGIGGSIMKGMDSLGALSDMSGLPQWLKSKVGNPMTGATPSLPAHPAGVDMNALAAASAAEQLARKKGR